MTPDDSARNRKMRKMMSLNCSICSMPVFGVGKDIEFGLRKGGPPSSLESAGLKSTTEYPGVTTVGDCHSEVFQVSYNRRSTTEYPGVTVRGQIDGSESERSTVGKCYC